MDDASRLRGILSTSLEQGIETAHSETEHVTRDNPIRIPGEQVGVT